MFHFETPKLGVSDHMFWVPHYKSEPSGLLAPGNKSLWHQFAWFRRQAGNSDLATGMPCISVTQLGAFGRAWSTSGRDRAMWWSPCLEVVCYVYLNLLSMPDWLKEREQRPDHLILGYPTLRLEEWLLIIFAWRCGEAEMHGCRRTRCRKAANAMEYSELASLIQVIHRSNRKL